VLLPYLHVCPGGSSSGLNVCFGAMCDQSGCDAVRGELAIQGVCELSHGGCECLTLLETLVFKGSFCLGLQLYLTPRLDMV
jgi:hypothetical protein